MQYCDFSLIFLPIAEFWAIRNSFYYKKKQLYSPKFSARSLGHSKMVFVPSSLSYLSYCTNMYGIIHQNEKG